MNHQDNLENEKQVESLTDLELTIEHADETKAGTGAGGGECSISSFNFMKKVDK